MKKLREQEPESFGDFWSIWQPHMRHTDGRGLAREAYRKHILNGAEPQDIIDGARWFIRNMKERDREFIPLAESSELVIALDLAVIRGGLDDLRRWQQLHPRFELNVNLSGRHLDSATGIADLFTAALVRGGLSVDEARRRGDLSALAAREIVEHGDGPAVGDESVRDGGADEAGPARHQHAPAGPRELLALRGVERDHGLPFAHHL